MKILVITPIFLPDEFPIAHLLFDTVIGLVEKGHSVQVITGGVDTQSVDDCSLSLGDVDGLEVLRISINRPQSGNLVKKALDYFKFGRLVYRYRHQYRRPDVIYTVVPSNENGVAAKRLAKFYKCPYVINVQDIHPDAIFSTGIIKNKFLKYILRKQERWMYDGSSGITVIGNSFLNNLQQKFVKAPIKIIPNWVNVADYLADERDAVEFRRELGIGDDQFVVLYSGTFGRIHGTEVLLEAATKLRSNKDIVFLLIGKGVGFEACQGQVKALNLQNVVMLPPVPRSKLAAMQSSSDVSVVTLLPSLGYTSIPSKVLGYMAAARPVIALADSDCDTALLIAKASCGFVLPPGDEHQFTELLLKLINERDLLKEKGLSGQGYVQENLSKSFLISSLNLFIKEVVDQFRRC